MKKQIFFDIGKSASITPSQIEGVLLLILGISKTQLFQMDDIPSHFLYDFQKYIYDMQSGKPDAYIFWKECFYGRDFYVNENVLIPRNDTEVLVSRMLDICNKNADIKDAYYIDIGTGTGCIGITLLLELHPLNFLYTYFIDISSLTLDVTRKNIATHKLPENFWVLEWNLLHPLFLEPLLPWKKIYISANLPYIKNGDFWNVWKNVQDFEPEIALYGGKNTWFEMYEELIKQCFQCKKIFHLQDIHLFIEIGFDQYEYSKKYIQELGLWFEYFPDLHKIQRVIHIFGF